jgi:hypothetical protein
MACIPSRSASALRWLVATAGRSRQLGASRWQAVAYNPQGVTNRSEELPCPSFVHELVPVPHRRRLSRLPSQRRASSAQTRPGSKLLLTGGVSSIDGAGGGGLTPWAVTGGYASGGEVSGTAHATRIRTKDYAATMVGIAASYGERIEVSLARQELDTADKLAPLNAALAGLRIQQDILGAKLRLAGDAVLDSDTWMPQIAAGIEHKRVKAGALEPTLVALGAKDSGTDFYLSATKLFLAPGVLVNATLRATNANQNGLLGFGGTGKTRRKLQPEASVAWLLNRHLAIGAEYRAKPDNLSYPTPAGNGLQEDDWKDLFIAWAPYKHVSLTLAYVDLGRIAPALVSRRQTGSYLSAQIAF